jgi:hypothetical protein
MPRLMSVAYTADAVIERRKTVTRRVGWRFLKQGDELDLCRKVMGRKKGELLERLARVRVVDVRREPLNRITAADVDAEGVDLPPGFSGPVGWAAWYAGTMGCPVDAEVTRIEWEYLDD